jgi:hypothetical protein
MLKNPNPVMSVNGELTQISDQYRGYVFCSDCEHLLNKNGEKWVQNNIPCAHDSAFPMQDAIRLLTPIYIEDDLNVYNVSGEEAFDMEQLVYFGMSIFWRGAVHQWKSSAKQEAPKVELGVYQQPIRKFLLGMSPLPHDVVLLLFVWPFDDLKTIPGLCPVNPEESQPGCHAYCFFVPGLLFRLFFGEKIPDTVRALSAANGFVSVDVQAGRDFLKFTVSQLRSQRVGSKMLEMCKNIAAVRSPKK